MIKVIKTYKRPLAVKPNLQTGIKKMEPFAGRAIASNFLRRGPSVLDKFEVVL